MHPLAIKHFEKILKDYEIFADRQCKYYPCHFESQDCTWCFCPFYPCLDKQTGAESSRGWGCSRCHWIHKPPAAKEILNELKILGIKNPEEIRVENEKIKNIRNRVFKRRKSST